MPISEQDQKALDIYREMKQDELDLLDRLLSKWSYVSETGKVWARYETEDRISTKRAVLKRLIDKGLAYGRTVTISTWEGTPSDLSRRGAHIEGVLTDLGMRVHSIYFLDREMAKD